MLDATKLGKLTVGDIADYEEWRRDKRKTELIAITKDLYGDKIPVDALTRIEQELRKIPSILSDDGFDITAAQYLFWKSLSKNDPDITMQQVGNYLETSKLEEYSNMLFPPNLAVKKKRVRTKVGKPTPR